MSVSEYERHQIFQWLEEHMGPDRASSMMHLLPPVGWGDIVTRADLDRRVDRLDARIERVDAKIEKVDAKLDRLEGRMEHLLGRQALRTYLTMVASNATVAGLVVAAVQLG